MTRILVTGMSGAREVLTLRWQSYVDAGIETVDTDYGKLDRRRRRVG